MTISIFEPFSVPTAAPAPPPVTPSGFTGSGGGGRFPRWARWGRWSGNGGAMGFGPDEEAAYAILLAWNAVTQLASAVPGGLLKDRLATPTARPYARMSVKQGPEKNKYSSGYRYIDYREVKIDIYGIGDVAIGQIVPAVQKVLDDPLTPLQFFNPLCSFMRCEPLDVTFAQEGEIKSGEDYRAARMRWCVWTDRRIPGH